VQVHVNYYTRPANANPTGLGLRIHFDSTMLVFDKLSHVLSRNLIQQQLPANDVADWDDDPQTDKYVLVSWADFAGAWPGEASPRLLTLDFHADDAAAGATTVNFTASSTSAGWELDSRPASIVVDVSSPEIQLDSLEIPENLRGVPVGKMSVDSEQAFVLTVDDDRFEVVGGELKLKADAHLQQSDAAAVGLRIVAHELGSPNKTFSQSFNITVLPNPFPYTNSRDAYDVNDDGLLTPIDALMVINRLNDTALLNDVAILPTVRDAEESDRFFDVNSDGLCTPLDALRIINALNRGGGVEGEVMIGAGQRQRLAGQSAVFSDGTSGLAPQARVHTR
jgi:hypothetical protein